MSKSLVRSTANSVAVGPVSTPSSPLIRMPPAPSVGRSREKFSPTGRLLHTQRSVRLPAGLTAYDMTTGFLAAEGLLEQLKVELARAGRTVVGRHERLLLIDGPAIESAW